MPKLPIDIFDNTENQIKDLIDPEEIVNIDFEWMEGSAQQEAEDMITNLSHLYYDDEFMSRQPNLKKRIDADLESLRINLKMRKADEIAHDVCLKNISQNPSNASMYKSLTELQRSILSITTKIEDTIAKLSNLLKGYQTEFNFEPSQNNENSDNQSTTVYRGSKDFIKAMNEETQDSQDNL